MEKVIDHFEQRMIAGNLISKDETAIVRYGLEVFFISFLELAAIFALAALVGNLFQTVLFFMAFIPLRVFAGGYHALTRLRCFVLSVIVYGMFTVLMAVISDSLYGWLTVGGIVLTGIIVWRWSPIIHPNRRFNEQDRRRYRCISLKIFFLDCLLCFIMRIFLPTSAASVAMALGMLSESLAILVAVLDEQYRDPVKGGTTNETMV